MSHTGDVPQQGCGDCFRANSSRADSFLESLHDGEFADWSLSAEDRAWADGFRVQCWSDWQAEAEAKVAARAAAESTQPPQLAAGQTIPADLDLTEVFAAVPPEYLFDECLRNERLRNEYLPDGYLPDECMPDECMPDEFDPACDLNPIQRRKAQFVDRAIFFEKVIAWAQAGKAQTLAEAWDYTCSTAETGRPQAGPAREHDWDATFAAQQGLMAEMACALRIPIGTASGLLQESRTLVESRPQTLVALRTGQISLRQARRLLDQLDSVPTPAQSDLEAVLLPHAKLLTAAQFDGKARKLREHFHPDSITVRRARCLADRKIMLYPDKDGMATLWMRAASDDLTAVYNRVTDAALSLQSPDEPRTLSQLRADVAVDLLASGVTETGLGAGISATVNVTVPVLTLMGQSEEPGELEGYGPIDPETARRLAGTATSFLRILTHPHTGIVLDVSATPFRVPAALKKYLRLRDGTCRFPGCNRAARHSDLDHTLDKQFGGPTSAANLFHLCPANHNLKHFSAWAPTAKPDGTLTWCSPAGKHYATDPATRIGPHRQTIPAPERPTPAAQASPTPPVHDPWTSRWQFDVPGPQPF